MIIFQDVGISTVDNAVVWLYNIKRQFICTLLSLIKTGTALYFFRIIAGTAVSAFFI